MVVSNAEHYTTVITGQIYAFSGVTLWFRQLHQSQVFLGKSFGNWLNCPVRAQR